MCNNKEHLDSLVSDIITHLKGDTSHYRPVYVTLNIDEQGFINWLIEQARVRAVVDHIKTSKED